LAKEHGGKSFYPKDPVEGALTLAVANNTEDRFTAFATIAFSQDPAAKEGVPKEKEKVVAFAKNASKLIGNGFVAGPNITYGDLVLWDFFDQADGLLQTKALIAEDPNLKAWAAKVEAVPSIKEYLATRK